MQVEDKHDVDYNKLLLLITLNYLTNVEFILIFGASYIPFRIYFSKYNTHSHNTH